MLPDNMKKVKDHVKKTLTSNDKAIKYPHAVEAQTFFDTPGLEQDAVKKVISYLVETGEIEVTERQEHIQLLPPFGNDETSGAE
ncbi:hypothetical protein [Flavihumibacter solisilvae]|uniref:Uncharacterized protein n=1 Tax=Flavihumibacter solisilvae TaxID=1349421 RepID=A0A0C1KST6_9BACT|nr:hypothetical protein [Flavihumibacter solisilvae]KIC90767.1 hypothetical protein OI18_23065 [Flavihumibacter solisilvae]